MRRKNGFPCAQRTSIASKASSCGSTRASGRALYWLGVACPILGLVAYFIDFLVLKRLAVPWALLLMLIASALLPGRGYALLLLAQVTGYALGITGTLPNMCRRSRWLGAAGSFVMLNTAAWLAFWVWLSGRADRAWRKVEYGEPVSLPGSADAIPVPQPEVAVPAGHQGV